MNTNLSAPLTVTHIRICTSGFFAKDVGERTVHEIGRWSMATRRGTRWFLSTILYRFFLTRTLRSGLCYRKSVCPSV